MEAVFTSSFGRRRKNFERIIRQEVFKVGLSPLFPRLKSITVFFPIAASKASSMIWILFSSAERFRTILFLFFSRTKWNLSWNATQNPHFRSLNFMDHGWDDRIRRKSNSYSTQFYFSNLTSLDHGLSLVVSWKIITLRLYLKPQICHRTM